MTIFFTSDTHFGHENVLRLAGRPFDSIEQMNRVLLANINQAVGPKDELWVLGDFSYRITRAEAIAIREEIRCENVHLVYGNHDKDYDGLGVFSSTQSYKELKSEYGKVALFHYPIEDWNCMCHGSLHLHGHIHSRPSYNEAHALEAMEGPEVREDGRRTFRRCRLWDVGVDANGYAPVSLDFIAESLGMRGIG